MAFYGIICAALLFSVFIWAKSAQSKITIIVILCGGNSFSKYIYVKKMLTYFSIFYSALTEIRIFVYDIFYLGF